MTVAELKKLIENESDNTEVCASSTSEYYGYMNGVSTVLKDMISEKIVIIAE